jgi:hypothetical protein
VLQRKLQLLTRISLGFRTSVVLLRMLLSAGYFTRNGQRRTK